MKKCKACKSILVDGPLQHRSAESKPYKVNIENIPTKVCPTGCEGFYWTHLDFGAEIFDLLLENKENYAKKKGFFKIKQLCTTCDAELNNATENASFDFSSQLPDGNTIKLSISSPSLICSDCNTHYLPAQTNNDSQSIMRDDVITAAICKDLIWK